MPARPSPPLGLPRSLPPNDRYRRATNVTVVAQGDTIVLIELERGRRYRLDPLASALWRSLNGDLTVSAVAAWLTKHRPITRDAEVDAIQLLAELYGKGLIEPQD